VQQDDTEVAMDGLGRMVCWLGAWATLLALAGECQAAAGRTAGLPSVTPGGEAAYSIPLDLPAGTAGLTPTLSLEYRHRGPGGTAGTGWHIGGLSRIERCPRTIAQDGQAGPVRQLQSDRFCLDGRRLVAVNGQAYGSTAAEYRTEVESFARIRTSGTAGTGPQQFLVETADALVLEYGSTADSRIDVGGMWTAGSATARVWALSRVRDRSGNTIDFRYAEDPTRGSYRLVAVEYTGNPSAGITPSWQVAFVYESRPETDAVFASEGGVVVSDALRLGRIDVLHQGAVVRRYDLGYEPALSSAGRSRLASLQECGAGAGECLAATSFEWQDGESGLGSERAVEVTTGGSTVLADDQRWWTGDIDGDGRDDLAWVGGSLQSPTLRYRLAQPRGDLGPEIDTGVAAPAGAGTPLDYDGDGFGDALIKSPAGRWLVLRGGHAGLGPAIDTGLAARAIDFRAADVDGNGLPDLVYSEIEGNSDNGLVVRVRYNVPGAGFSATPVTLYEQAFHTGYERPEGGGFLGIPGRRIDLDGDGREEVLLNETYSIARIAADQAVSEPFAGTFRGGVPADLNGDGCTDFVYPHYTGNWRARISACRVASQPKELLGPPVAGLVPGSAVAFDWDGDGRDDVLYRDASSAWRLVRSTGSTLKAPVSTSLPHGSPLGVRLGDLDGNGLPDLVARGGTQLRYRLRPGQSPDLLRRVRDGLGAAVAFEYSPLTREGLHRRRSDARWPDRDLQDARQVVTRLEVSDGTGGDGVLALGYEYEGLRRNGIGRGDLGFALRRVTRASPGTGQRETETYRQDFPFVGLPSAGSVELLNGRRVREWIQGWEALVIGTSAAARRYPYVSQVVRRHYAVGGVRDGAEASVVTMRAEAIDAQSGLATELSVTTLEAAAGDNPGASHTKHIRHASVFGNSTEWCLGRPQRTETTVAHTLSGGEPLTTVSEVEWDGNSCRPVALHVEPDSSEWRVTTTYGYDRFGNLATRTVSGAGMSPRTDRIDWGTTGLRPLRFTNALSQSSSLSWSAASGLPSSATDPNGLRTTWSYDGLGRLALEVRPDGTRSAIERIPCSGDCDARARYRLSLREQDDAGATFRSTHYELDRHERAIRRSVQLPGGAYAVAGIDFDSLGRVSRQVLPRWEGSSETGDWRFRYDEVGRVTSAQLRDATGTMRRESRVGYDGLAYTVTDPRGHATRRAFTAWGDVLGVTDALGSTSTYQHDAAGRLLRAIDALGRVVSTAEYDGRGFKVAQRDMDLGAWRFTYNALGELLLRTDARGRSASFSYDSVGRLLRRSEPEGATTWTWGTQPSARNVGRLTAVAGPGYSESLLYDSRGRLATRTIRSDATYQYGYAYNRYGLPDSLTYPASTAGVRLRVTYGYSQGYLSRIADSAAPEAPLWQLGAVDASGRALDETLGTNLRVTTGYDPVTGEMEYRQAGPGGGAALQDLAWDWDRAGDLVSRRDLRRGLHEEFTLDALGRLRESRLNGVVNLALRYDTTGNVTWKSDVCAGSADCYSYDATRRHAVVSAGERRFYYDANGNMTSRGGAPLGWTSFNLPSYIGAPGSSNYSQFWYGPDRNRWKQVARDGGVTETTLYVGGRLEKVTRAGVTAWKHYVESPTGVVALVVRDNAGAAPRTHYLLTDHLGSVDKVVRGTTSAIDVAQSFDAFGKRRGADWSGTATPADLAAIGGTTRRGFTGQEQLDHLGLVHLNGRVYDPAIARFTSADPSIHAPFDAQDLNRYSYAWNRPLAVVDPSGGEEVECLHAPGGPCQGVTVTGMRHVPPAIVPAWFGAGAGQVASAAERDPCGQDGSAAACNGLGRTAGVTDTTVTDATWTRLGAASLNAIPGWYYSGQAAAALRGGDLLSAVLFYGATAGDVFLLGRGSSAALASRYAQAEIAVVISPHFGRVGASRGAVDTAQSLLPKEVARIVAGDRVLTTLGRPGAEDVFVVAADDIVGMNAAQLAQRLTIPSSEVFTVIRFPTPESGLAAPVFRTNPGFLEGGLTRGGAREFIIPNGPLPPGAVREVIGQ